MTRERKLLMIRGIIMGSGVDTWTKEELYRLLDSMGPECLECGAAQYPTVFTCPDCEPRP